MRHPHDLGDHAGSRESIAKTTIHDNVEPPVLLKSSPSGWRDRLIRYDCSTREELRMNRKFRMTMVARIVIPAFGMAMAGHAFAADAAMSTGQAKAMSNAPATNSPPADARQANHAFRDMRATKLIGSDVRNAQNENLGEIKDLVIDVNAYFSPS